MIFLAGFSVVYIIVEFNTSIYYHDCFNIEREEMGELMKSLTLKLTSFVYIGSMVVGHFEWPLS